MEFDWDDANVEHIAQHGIEPEEAEDALLDPDGKDVDAYNRRGEKRFAYLGATQGGRLLFVVFTERKAKLRVLSARDADVGEKRRYRRRK